MKEVVITLYLSILKQGKKSRMIFVMWWLKKPRTTITSVIDRFRKRGSMENIQRKAAKIGRQRYTKTFALGKRKQKKEVCRMPLLCLIKIGNRPFLNELFRELCTCRNILGGLYRNVSVFVKLIGNPDFPGEEVTDRKLSTTTGLESSLLMSVKWTSVPIVEYLFGGR